MSITEIVIMCVGFVFVLLAGYAIAVLVQLKNTLFRAEKVINETGMSVNAALKEAEATLKSIRQVTDNVNAVTEDARQLSSTLVGVATDIRHASDTVKNVTANFGSKVMGFKAGISVALEVLKSFIASRRKGE